MGTTGTISRPQPVLARAALCCGIAIALIAGCPGAPPAGGGDGGDGEPRAFAGAETCTACHAETHADWSATAHATALETLEASGQGENADCLPCHTVAFEDGGFTTKAETPELAGVQCENCHGAAAEHAANPGDAALRPTIDMAATLCGGCHNDAHHPTFEEWSLSKHGNALAGLRTSSHAQDSCLECHSQDYRYAIEEQEEGKDVEVPTVETATLSLECATCHDPHGGVAQEYQLRKPIADLCGECHTAEEASLGDSPHHPQIEVLTGIGGLQADGSALEESHTHSALAAEGGEACARCHVVRHEVEDPNEGSPNVTGHTFNPFDTDITEHQADQYTGCAGCHTAETAGALRTALQADVTGRLDALSAYFDAANALYIDPESLSAEDQARLAVAQFDYQFVGADGSRGVHNPSFVRAALETAEEVVNDLSGQ